MTDGRIGMGIVSFAHGHVHAYARQLRTFPDARLTAAWDWDGERGAAGAAEHGMDFEPDLDALLRRVDTQVVIVAAETNRHCDLVLRALAAGRDVLLQKPMAMTVAECDRIVDAVDRSGAWFSMAFQMRCDPQNIRMRELCAEGAIGRVGILRRRHAISALFSRDFTEGRTRWHISAEENRGMFFDDAIHAMDWLYWTVGARPVSVMAEVDNVLTTCAPDDTGIAIFRFADGTVGEVFNSSVAWAGENTTEIYGDRGMVVQNFGDSPSCALRAEGAPALRIYRADEAARGWQECAVPSPTGHGARIEAVARAFVDAYRSGTPICSARDGRVSVEMCLAAYESAATGRRVTLPA